MTMQDSILYLNIVAFVFFALTGAVAVQRALCLPVQGIREDNKQRQGFWLLLIFAVALLLRLWGFGLIPAGINQDGAMAAVDGKALAEYGTDRLGTKYPAHLYAWGYGQMSALLSYLIALCVKLFGLSTVTARLPQLVASLMGGVCFYVFVRDAFGKRAGLIAAALAAINPWHMLQSRWAIDCNLLPHFFVAGLCFLQRGLMGRRIWLYVSMLFFGLCMYCYGIAIYTVSPFLLFLGLYLVLSKRLRFWELLLCGLVWLTVSAPFIITMAINYFKWDTIELPFVTMQYFSGSIRSSDILFMSENFPRQLWENLKSFVNVVILQKRDLPWNDMAGFGTMYKFAMPLAGVGLFALIKSRGVGKALTVAVLLTGVFAGLATNGVNINRVNLAFYFVLLLVGLGLELIVVHIKQARLPSAVIFLFAASIMAGTYFGSYANQMAYYFYDGFGEALLAAEESGAQQIYITADAQREGYGHVSEALTLFYSEIDAEYYQGKTNLVNGEERLPYRQRYRYISMDHNSASLVGEDTAFVIRVYDAQYFNAPDFDISFYGYFACVQAKK